MTQPGDESVVDLGKLGEAWDPEVLKKQVEALQRKGDAAHKLAGAHIILAAATQLLLEGVPILLHLDTSLDVKARTGRVVISFEPSSPSSSAGPLDPSA